MSEHVVISPNQAPYSVSGPSEEQGFTYDQRGPVNNTVYRVDSDRTLAPEDESVVLIDTSSNAVTLTVDVVPPGTRFTVINESGNNTATVSGVSALTVIDEKGVLPLDADGELAELTHAVDGQVYVHGDAIA